jgi:glycosyltransferase involved in cell wall biosynthesis
MKNEPQDLTIAVIIPCFNEQQTIGKVINDFRRELPHADIYVFDNNSTDNSHDLAVQAGAIVYQEKRLGKGYVVNSMLKKVSADLYVLVDGDDTYQAEEVNKLIKVLISEEADMVVGQRLDSYSKDAFRPLHHQGNKLISKLINLIFSSNLKDPMSGYRVFTNEVVLELPTIASGFDIETEMTLQMLYRKFVIKELPISYRSRPKGSESKLHTFRDGLLIILKILSIFRSYKPLTFFGSVGLLMIFFSIVLGTVVLLDYSGGLYTTNIVQVIFSAILALFGIISISIGVMINTLNFRFLELSNLISRNSYKTTTGGHNHQPSRKENR